MNESIIKQALKVMEEEFKQGTDKFNSSQLVKDYARLQLGKEQDEVFAVMFLDNHMRLLGFDKLFFGTVNQSTVHPRAIMRKVFEYNACKMILMHNHPSGIVEPSKADIELTEKFSSLFKEFDCNVLDHIIVSATSAHSMNESGSARFR